jgi:transposase
MVQQRRHFTREFKVEAVRRILEDGQAVSHVARDLGVNTNLVGRWKREFLSDQKSSFPGRGYQTLEQEELTRLRRENERLRRENEFLKKTAAFFAKESR